MLNRQDTGLMIVDVQGKLAEIVHESDELLRQLRILLQGAEVLELPIVWVEQLPDKLGATHDSIAPLIPGQALVKNTFNGMANPTIAEAVREADCANWLVAGIETHICVYQTVAGLLDSGCRVEVITDAVSSRIEPNKQMGIDKMASLGARLTSVEMALMELQTVAEGEGFRRLIQLIK